MLMGEWNSGDEDFPQEWFDFELMAGMGWTWDEMHEAPPYVRRYCRDFLRMRSNAERGSV